MKILHISDTHGFHGTFPDSRFEGVDVVVHSGDCSNWRDPYRNEQEVRNFLAWYESVPVKYKIYVAGNHEHYHGDFITSIPRLKEKFAYLANVHILDKEIFKLDDVTFVGGTLWTDMNNLDQLTMYHMKGMMNDYRQITMLNEAKSVYHKLTPEYTVEQHIKTKNYFSHVLSENRQTGANKPVVVCTHHSPSKQSTHPRYADDTIMNGAYSSDLSEFILDNPEIKFWTHGHTHHMFEYQIGECRVICNPRGYAGYEERAEHFDPTMGFDI